MNIKYFLIFLSIFSLIGAKVLLAEKIDEPDNYIEIDLIDHNVRLVNFLEGGHELEGNFSFERELSEEALSVRIKGEDVYLGGKRVGDIQFNFVREGNIIFINNLSLPRLFIKGRINLSKKEIFINTKGHWREDSEFLEGDLNTEIKIWGNFDNLLASGNIIIRDGRYNENDFQELRLYFLGKPPVLNLIDSSVTLKDGSVFKIQGELDLRNFANMIPDAEFVSQRIFIGGWQLFAENKDKVGLRKNIDDGFNVYFHTHQPEYSSEPEAEVRFDLKNNEFLQLRIQEDVTILGVGKKREF